MKNYRSKILTISMAISMAILSAFISLAEFGPGASEAELAAYAAGTAASDGSSSAGSANASYTGATGTGSGALAQNTSAATADTGLTAETINSLFKGTITSQITDQIILVVDHNLTLWNKQSDGTWAKDMDVYCGYGRNGLKAFNERHEGDQTTPIGSFPILHAFGFGSNPGTAMTWREITQNSYWSGEEDTYNTWVESATPIGGEHLIEYDICYKYAMAIGFNINPTVYKRGSAIFLHCKNPADWGSAGCVSVTESDMLTLLTKCHDGCYIMIVPSTDYISNF